MVDHCEKYLRISNPVTPSLVRWDHFRGFTMLWCFAAGILPGRFQCLRCGATRAAHTISHWFAAWKLGKRRRKRCGTFGSRKQRQGTWWGSWVICCCACKAGQKMPFLSQSSRPKTASSIFFSAVKHQKRGSHGTASTANSIQAAQLLHLRRAQRPTKACLESGNGVGISGRYFCNVR